MHKEFLPASGDVGACLGHLIEECGEVIAAAGKTVKFGWRSVNPTLPKAQQETNEDWLFRELDDLEGAIKRLRRERSGA